MSKPVFGVTPSAMVTDDRSMITTKHSAMVGTMHYELHGYLWNGKLYAVTYNVSEQDDRNRWQEGTLHVNEGVAFRQNPMGQKSILTVYPAGYHPDVFLGISERHFRFVYTTPEVSKQYDEWLFQMMMAVRMEGR